jgi:hypothetical protein
MWSRGEGGERSSSATASGCCCCCSTLTAVATRGGVMGKRRSGVDGARLVVALLRTL